jgi:hypothetical protein
MAKHTAVPLEVVAKLRSVCLRLPEAYEEAAWVGTRWCVRKKNFAHVLCIAAGWPPAYARAAGISRLTEAATTPESICVLTFRSPIAETNVHSFAQLPYFRPGWWPDIVGVVLDAATDWDEVAIFLTVSYHTMAPKKLGALLHQAKDR